MSRIEELTEAQRERIPEFVDRWTKIGLCTDPADRPRAEAAIRDMYRQGGLDPPKAIVWCGSPLAQVLTRIIILDKKLMTANGGVGTSVWASVEVSVRNSLEARIWDSVGASVRARVLPHVSVLKSVWASVREEPHGQHPRRLPEQCLGERLGQCRTRSRGLHPGQRPRQRRAQRR